MTATPLPRKPTGKLAFAYQTIASLEQARADLEAEVQRLREALRKEALEPPMNKTHRCIKCLHAYRPDHGDSEDCPACGHDGAALENEHA